MNRIVAQSICLAALTLSQLVASPTARAQPPSTWSLAGAGCVPAGQTASGIGTFNSAGDSKFAAGKTGEIILTCPVPSSIPGAVSIAVTYRDSDGPGNIVRLRASLRQKLLETGAVSDVSGAAIDSNSFPAAGANVRRSKLIGAPCTTGGFRFDHDRFTYYIQVNMTKRTISQDVLLASVDLGGKLIC